MALAKATNADVIDGGATVAAGNTFQHYLGKGKVYSSVENLRDNEVISGRFLGGPWGDEVFRQSGDDTAGSVSGQVTVHYPAAGPGLAHVLYGVSFGYAADTAFGALRMESPSGTVIYGPVPVTTKGFNDVTFEGLRGGENEDFFVILSDPQSNISGVVTVTGRGLQ